MKAVLISIQPKWCELIASGKKTVEVRKTKPKLETPFKVYIYATNPKKWFRFSSFGYASDESLWLSNGKVKMCDGFEFWADNAEYECLNGKVIGEFVCDEIFPIRIFENGSIQNYNYYDMEHSCVPYDDISAYIGKGRTGYGWHISDLIIYDTPKEFSEFYTVDNEAVKQCEYRERVYINPIFTNNALLLGSYICNKNETIWCAKCKTKPLKKPPQSWCYVERLGEG